MSFTTTEIILYLVSAFFGGHAVGPQLVALLKKLLGGVAPATPVDPTKPVAPVVPTPVNTGHPLRDLLLRLLASPLFGHDEAIATAGKLIAADQAVRDVTPVPR